jgi:hypothetical protein
MDRRTMTTDDDDDGRVTPEKHCPRLRMRTLWNKDNWGHSIPCVTVVGIHGVL